MAVLYRHLKPCGEVFYIGMGKDKKRAYTTSKRSFLWKKIVNKYGYEVQILKDDLEYEEAKELEISLISFYGRIDLKTGTLCNLTDGGEGTVGRIVTEEERENLRNKNIGKKHSPETIEKMRSKVISENQKKIISKANKNKILSNETKSKMSQSKKKGKPRPEHVLYILNKSKKVINIDTLKIYNSAKEVAELEGWNASTFRCRLDPNKRDKNNTKYRYL